MKKEYLKDSRLIVVSNRLPFYQVKDPKTGQSNWKQATGGLVTSLDPVLRQTQGIWLGWDGTFQKASNKKKIDLIDIRNIQVNQQIFGEKEGYYSVGNIPITEEEFDEYYNQFSNGILWALFHYFFEKCSINYNSWHTYSQVNWRFAEYIEAVSSPKDIIWIQDFHLLLVPYFLRKLRPQQKIHFFLHIPFPHIDIFSIIPWQKQLLESLLCCDTVGFHHKGYRRNALEAVEICLREKKKKGDLSPEFQPKTNFYINPISINFDSFDTTSQKPEVIERKDEIRRQCGAPKLILGIDRLDYSKGIKERLLALEFLLDKNSSFKESFCYYQLAVPSREDVPAYVTLKKEIDEIIGRINGKFSTGTWSPIHYVYNTVPFDELVALYLAADIGLITPLRDGMNLVCKEYIASHSDGDGVLILSKFAGAISDIKNCLAVNPYSIEDISNSILEALRMPEEERRSRMKKMRRSVQANNINFWLEKCFEQFENTQV